MDRATGRNDCCPAKRRGGLVEQPLIDLRPMLKRSLHVLVKVIDPFGWQPILQLNHLQPPFNNAKLRSVLLPAIDQKSFVASATGDQSDLGRLPAGYSCEGEPMASHIGLEILTKPRSLEAAKDLVAKSGYAGEKVVMLSPSDRPVYSQMAQVARDLFLKLGLNVDFQPLDWGRVIARRTNRNAAEQAAGACSTPRWDDNQQPRQQLCLARQLGQIFQPTAFRSDIQGHVNGPFALFWRVHRS
jgi:peptide/nickel transport system substrate-binding protein